MKLLQVKSTIHLQSLTTMVLTGAVFIRCPTGVSLTRQKTTVSSCYNYKYTCYSYYFSVTDTSSLTPEWRRLMS